MAVGDVLLGVVWVLLAWLVLSAALALGLTRSPPDPEDDDDEDESGMI